VCLDPLEQLQVSGFEDPWSDAQSLTDFALDLDRLNNSGPSGFLVTHRGGAEEAEKNNYCAASCRVSGWSRDQIE
jgi:hypothetical protein